MRAELSKKFTELENSQADVTRTRLCGQKAEELCAPDLLVSLELTRLYSSLLQYPRRGALDVEVAEVRELRRGQRVVARQLAAPAALADRLVLVHPAVGRREQRFVRFAVLREDRGARR